ncbi:conserved domain protein [Peptoniphilus sp. oral taxon 375 str. F0436]|nr:conserved domain protein [Peptoniphilus sp. oral taxon 375 str. F0436]
MKMGLAHLFYGLFLDIKIYSLYLYILFTNKGDYNFSSAQVRFRSFRCERLHLTFLNSAFALLGFIGIGHERGRPYRVADGL